MSNSKQQSEPHSPFWINFASGWVGGIGYVLVAQPFDIVKVRMQTQDPARPRYSGCLDCFNKILFKEGPLAFYKGTLSPLVGLGFVCALQFSAYKGTKSLLQAKFGL